VPQAQAAQQRLKHVSAPPSYGHISHSSKVHLREEYIASVQIKVVIFTLLFCSSAECSSPAATVSCRRRQSSGQRPGHHDQARATHSERRLGKRPRHHDQVPATHKERRRGKRPGHTAKYLWQATAAGNRLATTTKHLPGATGIGLGTTFKYRSQCMCVEPELPSFVRRNRIRASINPNGTETNAAGRGARACVARES
jgi:hypothetical protein